MYFLKLLLFCFMLSVQVNSYAKDFVFTAIPDQDETKLQQRFDKVAAYLSEQLGVPVKYVPVKSYAAAVTAFSNNQVQLAWFGGLSGIKARDRVKGSTALAQGVEDKKFVTYLIANKRTGIPLSDKLPDSIKGKVFTFGSKGSTSGRLMPEYYVRNHFGEAPKNIFSRVGFSGDHNRTIALVESGAYEVGAVNYEVWENAVKLGKVDTNKVSVIWKTPEYPDYQWSVRGDVDATWGSGFVSKIQQALLAMDAPDLLAAFPRSGFITASNSDYEPIKNVAKEIGLID
ncbi:MAG: putative selenate ABC transporter substrate-binding protein [Gammaproteobacteria bacterium]|nr:putative selenate ABC transporter substrate-binding protein [Gammaproteobacteria bacterium]